MSEFDNENGNEARRGASPWRRVAIAGAIAVVAMGVGAAAATNGVSTFYGPAMHVAMNTGGGMGKGFIDRRFGQIMDEIGASREQSEKLRGIFEAARDDLMPARSDFESIRGEMTALISAPKIDREAAERMRAQRVEAIDRASRRMTDAFIEAAEVLTPEQRLVLVENMKDRRWHGRRR
jgi:periplasmic protein CpxP/Spy